MSVISPLPALLLLALAMATMWLLDRLAPLRLNTQRIGTLDGLRGYLAFGVFLHHSCIWYFYLKTGIWALPPSQLYTQFGQVSVSLFFMITAFLFTSKIIKFNETSGDWLRLYISRLTRIVPLWAVVTFLAAAIVMQIKHLGLDAENPPFLKNSASSGLLTAGVTWTLHFEWTFYFFLPWLALLLKKKPPVIWLVLSAIFIISNGPHRLFSFYTFTFLGGIAAAWLVRVQFLQTFARSRMGSLLALALLTWTITGFAGAYSGRPTLLLTVAFVLIAAGADLFGLLNLRLSCLLGEITYSVYLLHGLMLYLAFRFVLGFHIASSLNAQQHWAVVGCVTPVLISLSYLSFRYIETPAIQITQALTDRAKSLLCRLDTFRQYP
ncbi:MAG: acyltransferase family protein [Brachymonas sp.]